MIICTCVSYNLERKRIPWVDRIRKKLYPIVVCVQEFLIQGKYFFYEQCADKIPKFNC
jgi:hypothetical protein